MVGNKYSWSRVTRYLEVQLDSVQKMGFIDSMLNLKKKRNKMQNFIVCLSF